MPTPIHKQLFNALMQAAFSDKTYADLLSRLDHLGDIPGDQITPEELAEYRGLVERVKEIAEKQA